MSQVDHFPILKIQASCKVILVSLGVSFRHVFAQVLKMCVCFFSPALLLLSVAVVEMRSHCRWPRRWRCSVGLSKLDVSSAVVSNCCFSLAFHFRCVISVHAVYSCSPYVKLSNIWDCLKYSYNYFLWAKEIVPKTFFILNF